MDYAELVAADMRLVILDALSQDSGYSHNQYVIQRLLGAAGHDISMDRLHTELAWLDEQRLITLEAAGGISVAKLTTRGADVAKGRASVPGVQRPGPGA